MPVPLRSPFRSSVQTPSAVASTKGEKADAHWRNASRALASCRSPASRKTISEQRPIACGQLIPTSTPQARAAGVIWSTVALGDWSSDQRHRPPMQSWFVPQGDLEGKIGNVNGAKHLSVLVGSCRLRRGLSLFETPHFRELGGQVLEQFSGIPVQRVQVKRPRSSIRACALATRAAASPPGRRRSFLRRGVGSDTTLSPAPCAVRPMRSGADRARSMADCRRAGGGRPP